MASPPRTPTPPAAQVRQYSWRHYTKKEACLYAVVPSRQKSERENQQYSVIRDNAECSNSELNQLVHIPQYANNIHTLKPLKARKEEDDLKFKCPRARCQKPKGPSREDSPVRKEKILDRKKKKINKKYNNDKTKQQQQKV